MHASASSEPAADRRTLLPQVCNESTGENYFHFDLMESVVIIFFTVRLYPRLYPGMTMKTRLVFAVGSRHNLTIKNEENI